MKFRLFIIGALFGIIGMTAFSDVGALQQQINNQKQKTLSAQKNDNGDIDGVDIKKLRELFWHSNTTQQNNLIVKYKYLDEKLGYTHHDTPFGWWEGHWWGLRVVINHDHVQDIVAAGDVADSLALVLDVIPGLGDIVGKAVGVIISLYWQSAVSYSNSTGWPVGFRFNYPVLLPTGWKGCHPTYC